MLPSTRYFSGILIDYVKGKFDEHDDCDDDDCDCDEEVYKEDDLVFREN